MMDTVHVLLPAHNRREVTLKFVRCLEAQTYPAIHLILIDDGSTDGTASGLREAYPSVEVIRGNGRWWWAGCLQRGFDCLKEKSIKETDIVLLANDDTTFAPDYVERAVRFLDGKVSCMLLSRVRNAATGEVEESGVCADLRTMTFQEAKEPALINCLSTRGLFLRWSDMQKIGGFHPIMLPHYLSDYEYTIRAVRRGLACVTTSAVWLNADFALTGERDVDSIEGWKFIRTLLSVRCTINPLYMTSFVLLAVPLRWMVPNLVRIWGNAMRQILRRGVLRIPARIS